MVAGGVHLARLHAVVTLLSMVVATGLCERGTSGESIEG